ncbi:MAG TPA: hypothetical protein PKJ25_10645 [Smithellaceae bacterium]|jgi:hypothetical protein|nr:hypothetical protein [Smithellaceae bacterium]
MKRKTLLLILIAIVLLLPLPIPIPIPIPLPALIPIPIPTTPMMKPMLEKDYSESVVIKNDRFFPLDVIQQMLPTTLPGGDHLPGRNPYQYNGN